MSLCPYVKPTFSPAQYQNSLFYTKSVGIHPVGVLKLYRSGLHSRPLQSQSVTFAWDQNAHVIDFTLSLAQGTVPIRDLTSPPKREQLRNP